MLKRTNAISRNLNFIKVKQLGKAINISLIFNTIAVIVMIQEQTFLSFFSLIQISQAILPVYE